MPKVLASISQVELARCQFYNSFNQRSASSCWLDAVLKHDLWKLAGVLLLLADIWGPLVLRLGRQFACL